MPMATQLQRVPALATRKLTVDDVIHMADARIIGETERVELIDGRLVEMSPEGPEHAGIVGRLTTLLARMYPERYEVRSQSTLPISTHEYVEPDVYVIDSPSGTLEWPSPDKVVLTVEVANTSAAWDLTGKATIYAGWGVPVYMVVDLTQHAIVVHTDRGPDGYRTVSNHRGDEPIGLPGLDATITAADILRSSR